VPHRWMGVGGLLALSVGCLSGHHVPPSHDYSFL
jgi:hypothetical protein